MQKLHSYVFNKVTRLAILPILMVEIFLIIIILITVYYTFQTNRELAMERSRESFKSLTVQIAKQMEHEFERVIKDATALKQIIETVFKNNHIHSSLEIDFVYDENFYFINNLGIASVYTTNIDYLTIEDKKNLEILYLIAPIIDAVIKKYDKKVDSAWINIGSKYSLYYPKINIKQELSPSLDATKQSYYFQADKEHNPQKKTIFIPLVNELWALNIGQIGAVVSPIYKDENMIGVIGISLTAENTKKLSTIELPFNAYVMITDEEGYLLFSSNEEQSYKDFSISSFTRLYEMQKKEALKIFSYSLDKNSDYLFHEHDLSDTSLKLILVTKKSEISKDYVEIYEKSRNAGLVLLFFIFVLHVYLYRKIKKIL